MIFGIFFFQFLTNIYFLSKLGIFKTNYIKVNFWKAMSFVLIQMYEKEMGKMDSL